MWIKTSNGNLINTDKVECVYYCGSTEKIVFKFIGDSDFTVSVDEETQEYLGKLAEKLGAEAI